jgi:hypothetical protein
VTRANPLSTFVPAEVAVAPWASVRPNGLALGRFSVIYATPPCVINPKVPSSGSRAAPEYLCLTRPYVPKARTLSVRPTKVLAICWGVWITGDTNG